MPERPTSQQIRGSGAEPAVNSAEGFRSCRCQVAPPSSEISTKPPPAMR